MAQIPETEVGMSSVLLIKIGHTYTQLMNHWYNVGSYPSLSKVSVPDVNAKIQKGIWAKAA